MFTPATKIPVRPCPPSIIPSFSGVNTQWTVGFSAITLPADKTAMKGGYVYPGASGAAGTVSATGVYIASQRVGFIQASTDVAAAS
jgi:hypothetical protein